VSTSSVLCFVEHDETGVTEASLRALTFARELAETSDAALSAVLLGPVAAITTGMLGDFGVTDAYNVLNQQLQAFAPVAWARSLLEISENCHASSVVAPGSDRGNEVLAHLAALSGLPMVANCFRAQRVNNDTVRLSRQRWAGSLIENSQLDATPALLSVAFDGVPALKASEPTTAVVQFFEPTLGERDLEVQVSEWRDRSAGVSLADARVVIGGGRGVGSAEGFVKLEELAQLLGGAVGVSRAVTSLGWRPHNQQVGQTGTRISPDLYLMSGISGATQHLAGCQSAKHVVAINIDAEAPIISRANYAVIGDLNLVIPALISAIRERGATGS
jgi:electron transfer flavoprotein alpha subunit